MSDQASEVERKLRAIPFNLRQRIDVAILRHAEVMRNNLRSDNLRSDNTSKTTEQTLYRTVPWRGSSALKTATPTSAAITPKPRVPPVVPQAWLRETPQGILQSLPPAANTPTAPRAFPGHFFRPSEALRNDAGAAQPYRNSEPRAPPAVTVPESENTSLFLTNLPARCDVAMLIGAVEALGPVTGRIWHSHVNPPDPPNGHFLSAAKIVFFKRAGARVLLELCQGGAFTVGGRMVHAQWNRHAESPDYVAEDGQGIPPPAPPSRELSRVVRFEGPHRLVGRAVLDAFFRSKFKFQTVKVVQVRQTEATRCLEWHFGGYHPQAQWAVMAVKKERPAVRATYVQDPCDVFP